MKGSKYIIEGYTILRHQQVIRNGHLLFEGKGGDCASFFTEVYKHFNINYPKFYKMDLLCKAGFLTSEILLQGYDLTNEVGNNGTGIVLYNAASSINTDRNHQQSIQDRSSYFPSPSVFVYTLANIVIGEICIRNKFYGEGTFFISEVFEPEIMYDYVLQLFEDEIVKTCITGWIELNGDHYDSVLYLVQKSNSGKNGIAIFEPEKINEIYLKRL